MGINTARSGQAMINVLLNWKNIDSGTASAGQRAEALRRLNVAYRKVMVGVYQDENGRKLKHTWTWCHEVATDLDLTDGEATQDAPSDFGGLVEDPTFQYGSSDSKAGLNITQIGPQEMREKQRDDDTENTPLYWALRAKDFTATAGSTYEFVFHPTPDADVTLSIRYFVAHADLTDLATSYPAGNWGIEELIIQQAKADFEREAGQVEGTEWKHLQDLMLAFVMEDMENYPTEDVQESVADRATGIS